MPSDWGGCLIREAALIFGFFEAKDFGSHHPYHERISS